MSKGLIHIYCGEGKGKTTAAIGLAIRAAGNNMKVIILQFLKGRDVSELKTLKLIENIKVYRYDTDYGFYNTMSEADKEKIEKLHNENLDIVLDMVKNKECDLLILDEICPAYKYGLVDKEKIKKLIELKPETLELVLTGRDPDPLFLEHADYVSEIKKIKHPYDNGIIARKGIEY